MPIEFRTGCGSLDGFMNMATRRTVRPDSKHHRDSRRQRLTRSARPGRKFSPMFWMNMIVASICTLAACGMIRVVMGPQGAWLPVATVLAGCWLVICILGVRTSL
jgi:hypothetical protein